MFCVFSSFFLVLMKSSLLKRRRCPLKKPFPTQNLSGMDTLLPPIPFQVVLCKIQKSMNVAESLCLSKVVPCLNERVKPQVHAQRYSDHILRTVAVILVNFTSAILK